MLDTQERRAACPQRGTLPFQVTFEETQPVDECAYSGTVNATPPGLVSPSNNAAPNENIITVQTFAPNGSPEPRAFHLAVFCT
jgi:hypothetical protein